MLTVDVLLEFLEYIELSGTITDETGAIFEWGFNRYGTGSEFRLGLLIILWRRI